MSAEDIKITRKEYILIAKRRGVKDAHKMSTDALIKVLHAKKYLLRKDYNAIAENRGFTDPQKMSTSDLLNALSRYDCKRKSYITPRKFKKIYPKFVKKQKNLNDDLHKATKLQNMSHDDFKKTAKLRGIKNHDTLAKQDLIYILLRSEKNLFEDNYEKYISNNTTNKLRSRINNIKIVLARLGNIITRNERDKIRKELYKIENNQKPTKTQKGRCYRYLISNTLDKKEKYKHSGYNDLDYTGIKDVENLFISADDDYYKPVLVKSPFENNYKYYEIRGGKDNKLSIKEEGLPELEGLINKRKNNKKKEQKVQLSISINFISINDKEITRTFYVTCDNEEILLGYDTSDITIKLIESFLSNYQKEEQILRGGSNYIFGSVDILGIHFHNITLKRGKSYTESPK